MVNTEGGRTAATTLAPRADEAGRPNRRGLADWTLEQIYAQIFSGQLSAGAVLSEAELSQALGVSRSPVRDALRQLEVAGLVDVSPINGQRVVKTYGVEDIFELYMLRGALESLASRLAAAVLTHAQLNKLEETQTAMELREAGHVAGVPRDYELDFRFHRLVCEATGRPRLEAVLSPLWVQTHALLRQLDVVGAYPRSEDEVTASYHDHRQILSALRQRDGTAVATAVQKHMDGRRDQLIAEVEHRGGLA